MVIDPSQLNARIGTTHYFFLHIKAQQQPKKVSVPQMLVYSLKTAPDIEFTGRILRQLIFVYTEQLDGHVDAMVDGAG